MLCSSSHLCRLPHRQAARAGSQMGPATPNSPRCKAPSDRSCVNGRPWTSMTMINQVKRTAGAGSELGKCQVRVVGVRAAGMCCGCAEWDCRVNAIDEARDGALHKAGALELQWNRKERFRPHREVSLLGPLPRLPRHFRFSLGSPSLWLQSALLASDCCFRRSRSRVVQVGAGPGAPGRWARPDPRYGGAGRPALLGTGSAARTWWN